MEEKVNEEISFLESSCERLRKEIERYSTPLDRRAQARDSGKATLVGATGNQSHATDDTVVLQENEQSGNLVEGASNEHVTARPARAQNRIGRSEKELADALYNYSLRNDEHPVMEFDHGNKGSRCNIKPATFDGSNSRLDYKSHFDACATINNWSEKEKGLYLAVSLKRTAHGVLGNVSKETGQHYDMLVKALEERFAPPNQTELYRAQLKDRKQRASETLSELGQAIRRLTCLAYPTATVELRETLGKDAFIDALVHSDMRLRIKQNRPENLNDAIRLAVELDAYYRTERRGDLRMIEGKERDCDQPAQSTELIELMTRMQTQLDNLEKQVQDQNIRRRRTLQLPVRNTNDGVACYYCKEKGHIRRNCSKLKDKETNRNSNASAKKGGNARQIRSERRRKQRNAQGYVGESTMINESGIFVEADIHGVRSKMLIDTGASLTLISKRVHDIISAEKRPALEESGQKVLNASGNPLSLYGKAEYHLKIGETEAFIPAMVTDITVHGILGLDFLKKGKGIIDLNSNTIRLNNEEYRISCEGTLGCFRVVAADDICIPPRSEMIVEAKVPGQNTFGASDYIFEPEERFLEKGRAFVGRTLVKGSETVPVWLMNVTDVAQQIYKGTLLAKMTAADEENPQETAVVNISKLRPDLRELLDRCKKNLSNAQAMQADKFLQRYQHLFASSNFDIGRTSVGKHKINTGPIEKQIKQGARRIPLPLMQEVDKQVNEMLEKGVIEPSNSPWASPVVLVRKKDGSMCFCIDYRRLNEVTVKDAYPLPNIEEAFDHLSGHALFSTLDPNSGYWQVAVEEDDKNYRHYLYGRRFLLRTDHGSLRWLLKFKNPEGQLARWLEVISTYDMMIEHRPVKTLQAFPKLDKEYSESENGNLLEAQGGNKDIQLVRQWVENGRRPAFSDVTQYGYVVKSLWNQFERLSIQNGFLVRRWILLPSNRDTFQVLIPDSERRNVPKMCHDNKTSGHLGVTKTLARIRQRYYWPGLQQDVHHYIAGCDACSRRKNPIPKRRAPMQIVASGVPMERLASDILCELPETDRGNRHILVVAYYFTKWTEAFALPNMEAETIARTVMEQVIVRFGVPSIIHSDQGRQYESKIFMEMCQLLGITKTRTTPYHPKSDGVVERFNRTLISMLSTYVQENQKDWDLHLLYILMAYRSTVHESTNFSPNMLMLGREATTPLDLMFEMPTEMKDIPAHQWVWVLRERLENAHAVVREHMPGEMLLQKK
ncbi:uncharacterized protein [Magallana gigas]|uniref:uncharacterized protein n=1 Tax=Magallana gigas TaxID=29159 RepID=UPI0033401947